MPRPGSGSLLAKGFDPVKTFTDALHKGPPWESIVDFATHKSFCGKKLFPRQRTLLRLIYLETEQMTQYDLDVIGEWTEGWRNRTAPCGVQPDVWDRIDYLKGHGYRHFPHVQAVMGRRASKGITGGMLGAERVAYMYSLDDWQAHFGVDPHSVGELLVVATSLTQAAKRQFADIRRTILNCAYLRPHIVSNRHTELAVRTPADERYLAELKAAKVPIEMEIASLSIRAESSTSTSGRGGAGFANFYDEMAHMLMGTGSAKSGEEIYEAYQPSLRQFGIHRLTYIPSSPFTMIGKFYELYKQGSVLLDGRIVNDGVGGVDAEEELSHLVADPEMLVFQLPSWELYRDYDRSTQIPMRLPQFQKPGMARYGPKIPRPIQPDPTGDGPDSLALRREEQRNPEKFRVEYRAQFASVIDAYLDPAMVDAMFETPPWREPLAEQQRGYLTRTYRIHADPSKSVANFAICIAHTEDAPPDENGDVWPCVIIDYLHVWKPEDFPVDPETGKRSVDYVQITKEIEGLLRRFPSTTKMTFDQWNSVGLISTLKRKFSPRIRITEQTFTKAVNHDRAEKFKSALNLGWVKSYRDTLFEDNQSLLETELKFLTDHNGRVDHQQFGPCTTKDLADTAMTVAVDLLHEALDRWGGMISAQGAYGSSDVMTLRSSREGRSPVATPRSQMSRGEHNRMAISAMREQRALRRTAPTPPTRGARWR